MTRSQSLLKHKRTLAREELAHLLESLAGRVREGRVALQQGAERVEAELPDALRLSIELTDAPKAGHVKRELELELSWRVDEDGAPLQADRPEPITFS